MGWIKITGNPCIKVDVRFGDRFAEFFPVTDMEFVNGFADHDDILPPCEIGEFISWILVTAKVTHKIWQGGQVVLSFSQANVH